MGEQDYKQIKMWSFYAVALLSFVSMEGMASQEILDQQKFQSTFQDNDIIQSLARHKRQTANRPNCGTALIASSGEIKSPKYPERYENNLYCRWKIIVPQDKVIQVQFLYLDITLGCLEDFGADFLLITDSNAGGQALGYFCGFYLPDPLVSRSNEIEVVFNTDGVDTGSGTGFNLIFDAMDPVPSTLPQTTLLSTTFFTTGTLTSTVEPTQSLHNEDCGAALEASSGQIKSPNYPEKYESNLHCRWKIIVPQDKVILIQFHYLEITSGCMDDFDSDFLLITDSNDSDQVLGYFCGLDIPNPLRSKSNKIEVIFNTNADNTESGTGFNLIFNTIDPSQTFPWDHSQTTLPSTSLPTTTWLSTTWLTMYSTLTSTVEPTHSLHDEDVDTDDDLLTTIPISTSTVEPTNLFDDDWDLFGVGAGDSDDPTTTGTGTEDDYFGLGFDLPFLPMTTIEPTTVSQNVETTTLHLTSETLPSKSLPEPRTQWRESLSEARAQWRESLPDLPYSHDIFDPGNLHEPCDMLNSTQLYKLDAFIRMGAYASGLNADLPSDWQFQQVGPEDSQETLFAKTFIANFVDGSTELLDETSLVINDLLSDEAELNICLRGYTDQLQQLLAGYMSKDLPRFGETIFAEEYNLQPIGEKEHNISKVAYDFIPESLYNIPNVDISEVTVDVFSNETVYWCSRILTLSSGVIQSPGYPSAYPRFTSCQWRIPVPLFKSVAIKFTDFNLGEEESTCSWRVDRVQIKVITFDEPNQTDMYCGSVIPPIIVTPVFALEVTLKMITLDKNSFTGFQAVYTTIDPEEASDPNSIKFPSVIEDFRGDVGETPEDADIEEEQCKILFTSQSGQLSSSDTEIESDFCQWNITVAEGSLIKLNISSVSPATPNGVECERPYAYLQIWEVVDFRIKELRYCGQDGPLSMTSISNKLLVGFYNSRGFQSTFDAYYTTVNTEIEEEQCKTLYTSQSGQLSSSDNEIESDFCEWNITVAKGSLIKLNILSVSPATPNGVECERPYAYLQIWEVVDFRIKELRYCGQDGPLSMTSTSNKLLVGFYNSRGFHSTFDAYYTTVNTEIDVDIEEEQCKTLYTSQSGQLSSSDTEIEYDFCEWNITISKGSLIKLEISSFSPTPNNVRCERPYAYLQIWDIVDGFINNELIYCGQDGPLSMTSTSNKLLVGFYNSRDFPSTFNAYYTTVDTEIDGRVNLPHGSPSLTTIKESGQNKEDRITNPPAVSKCWDVFVETNGNFSSPMYPNLYDANVICTWTILADPLEHIGLQFIDFDVDNPMPNGICDLRYSYVRIAYFDSRGRIASDQFCGVRSPVNVTISYSNQMVVYFFSELGIGKGFLAEYDTFDSDGGSPEFSAKKMSSDSGNEVDDYSSQFVPDESWPVEVTDLCGDVITNSGSVFASPGYPKGYSAFTSCSWVIMAKTNQYVKLEFRDFDVGIPASDGSCYDSPAFVEISHSMYGQAVMEYLCGGIDPTIITSLSNQLKVYFMSNRGGHKGFLAQVTFIDNNNGIKPTEDTRVPMTTQRPTQSTANMEYVSSTKPIASAEDTDFCSMMKTDCCFVLDTESSGNIVSPGYPDGFNSNLNCKWLIEADHDKTISLVFTDFELDSVVDESEDCTMSVSNVRVMYYKEDEVMEQYFCGHILPTTVVSDSKALYIEFHTANVRKTTGKGFAATYNQTLDNTEQTGGDDESSLFRYFLPFISMEDLVNPLVVSGVSTIAVTNPTTKKGDDIDKNDGEVFRGLIPLLPIGEEDNTTASTNITKQGTTSPMLMEMRTSSDLLMPNGTDKEWEETQEPASQPASSESPLTNSNGTNQKPTKSSVPISELVPSGSPWITNSSMQTMKPDSDGPATASQEPTNQSSRSPLTTNSRKKAVTTNSSSSEMIVPSLDWSESLYYDSINDFESTTIEDDTEVEESTTVSSDILAPGAEPGPSLNGTLPISLPEGSPEESAKNRSFSKTTASSMEGTAPVAGPDPSSLSSDKRAELINTTTDPVKESYNSDNVTMSPIGIGGRFFTVPVLPRPPGDSPKRVTAAKAPAKSTTLKMTTEPQAELTTHREDSWRTDPSVAPEGKLPERGTSTGMETRIVIFICIGIGGTLLFILLFLLVYCTCVKRRSTDNLDLAKERTNYWQSYQAFEVPETWMGTGQPVENKRGGYLDDGMTETPRASPVADVHMEAGQKSYPERLI